MSPKAVLTTAAHYVPDRIVTNHDLSKLMDTNDEWITERTGIKQRHHVSEPGTSSSDLGFIAAEEVIKKAGWKKEDVDLLVVATASPDYYFPGVATMLQKRLGLRFIPAFDIRQQCSAFVYGLDLIDSQIRCGKAKKALFVGTDVLSVALDFTTRGREMAVLFGDGAGAVAVEAQDGERGVIDSILAADGGGADSLCLKIPGTKNPGFVRQEDIAEARVYPFMDGKAVFKNAITKMCEVAFEILKRNGLTPSDVDLLVPHQANLRINEMVRDQLKLPEEKVINTIQNYGNTNSATIPIGLSEALRQGRLKEGDLVLTVAFGAGFTWGANLFRW